MSMPECMCICRYECVCVKVYFLCVYVDVCAHVYMSMPERMCICRYECVNVKVYFLCVCVDVCADVCMSAPEHMCIHGYECVHVKVYFLCVCRCACVWWGRGAPSSAQPWLIHVFSTSTCFQSRDMGFLTKEASLGLQRCRPTRMSVTHS